MVENLQANNVIEKNLNEILDDPVSHPSHYTSGSIEVKDFIRDQKLNFARGNAIKYIARAGKKEPEKGSKITKEEKEIQDLQKAAFYINDEIAALCKAAGIPCSVSETLILPKMLV